MGERLPDGATRGQHYESVERQTGALPERARGEGCPEDLRYVWDWFCSMCLRRQTDHQGRWQTITSQELLAWARLHGVMPTPYEAEALELLEDEFMRHARGLKNG